MPRIVTARTFGLIWMMPVIFIFFAAGLLQYIGLLSQTQSNWLALLLFSHVFLIHKGWTQLRHESLLLIFLLFVFFSYFVDDGPISYTFTYFYYIACSIVAAVAGRVYALQIASSISTGAFFKFAKYFLFIELVAVSVQRSVTEQFIGLARVPIGYADAIFGTFYLQSDAALAAACELLTVSTFFLQCKVKDRFIVTILSFLIIFLVNSNTAKASIFLIVPLLLMYNMYIRLHLGRYGLNIMLAIGATCFIFVAYGPLSGLFADLSAQATNDYYHRESWQTAARFSPLGQILDEKINVFGYGALTYYNPITKLWLYNAGFSTIYSLYLDFGVVGIVLYYSYQFILIFRFVRNYFEFLIFTSIFIWFSAFNFAPTDLAFTFSFNAILYLNYLRGTLSPQGNYRRNAFVLGAMPKKHIASPSTE